MSDTVTMADADARRALKDDLARMNCRVHQPDDPPLFTREPRSDMQTVLWRWSDMMPLLERIGEQIKLGSAGQRRTLRLSNPGLPYGTTHTFWGSIQYILPGEIAEAHRHTAHAFRFILQGRGCSTTVDGERYDMNEGDLVLTPSMTWHDHEHRGDEPMIWLDVLDISLMRSMHATFFEPYTSQTQPIAAIPDHSYRAYGNGILRSPRTGPLPRINPLLAYPRARAMDALDGASGLAPDPFDDVVMEYQNPVTGGPAMTTMAMRIQKLRPGFHGQARRHTGSKLYNVISGHGTTVVDGKAYDWGPGDFLSVKPWAWHEHINTSKTEDAFLFQVNDSPALDALGYYREEALQTNNGHQTRENTP